MSQIGNNKLKKNFNDWSIFSLINNTKINEKPIIAWKIVAGKKITVDVVFHIIRKFRNEIVVRSMSSQTKNVLGDLSVGAQKLNFYLPEDLVLFQSEVKQILPTGDITIKLPEMIAQIDRRENMRLFIENGMKSNVTFVKEANTHRVIKQKFIKECFDVSAGGFSFISSKSESKFFNIGDLVNDIQMNLDGQSFKVSGRVINIFEIEPNKQNNLHYKGWKICFRFKELIF